MKFNRLLLILSVLILASAINVNAQDSRLRKANKLFERFSYPDAAEEYKKILSKEDIAEAKIKLAECYRLMNRPLDAEYWYEKVIDLSESEDEHKLYYGYSLKANGKFEDAKQMFLEYSQIVPADSRGLRQVEACEMADYFLTDPNIYTITNLGVNSSESDFGPSFYKDGVVFASARGMQFKDKIYNWTGKPFLDLYESEREDEEDPSFLTNPKPFKGDLNTWMHEGTVTFNSDYTTMYFTRDNFNKGRKGKDSEGVIKLKIYEAKWAGEKWGNVREVSFNNDEYSVGHPTLSPDGQALYFISDMPGGYGETDVYVSYKTGDEWGEPENLGPEINTEGREMFPFMAEDGTLYFSSDALPGLGGLDIFSSKNENANWTPPQNLRYPINTNSDDFGFIINGEDKLGYFSSNRAGGKGDDDIYAFTKQTFKIEGLVVECENQEPIEDAIVQLVENGVIMQEMTTSTDGSFSFPVAKGKTYEVTASKANYKEGSQEVATIGSNNSGVEVRVPICPGAGGMADKCNITGVVTDKVTGEPIEGLTVRLVNSETNFEKSVETALDGSYNFDVDADTDYVVFVSGQYILTASKNISTKGIDCSSDLMKNIPTDFEVRVIPEELTDNTTGKGSENNLDGSGNSTGGLNDGSEYGSGNNGGNTYGDGNNGGNTYGGNTGTTGGLDITEILKEDYNITLNHIYYDFDRATIRTDAQPELKKLVEFLYQNPGITVELSSHTDSRGTNSYNDNLSQRRANSAVEYLANKGITNERLIARGYGEQQLVNECADGVSCSDTKHQENRRTEFKIVAYNNRVIHSSPRYFGFGITQQPSTTPITTYDNGGSYYDNDYKSPTYFDDGTSTSNDNTYTYTDSGSTTTSTESYPAGTEFKVQLVASATAPDMGKYQVLNDLGFVETEYQDGLTKVVLGPYGDRQTAEEIRSKAQSRGFYDSFIVVYQDGQRMR